MKSSDIKRKIKKIAASEGFKKGAFIALCAVAAICIICLISLLFSVKSFEIEGDTHYDINEIIDASGVRQGDRLYWLSGSKAEKKLLEGCPYLESVKVKRKFPNKICFEVKERVPGWYVQVGEDFYSLDYDLKVLLETAREDLIIERGLTKLVLPELESVVVGEIPVFGEGDEHLQGETLEIIHTIRTHKIKERLTYLDLSNRFEIKMTVDGCFEVNFGDMDNAATKFDMIDQIISTATAKGYVGGEINVINPAAHSFRGYYAEGSVDTDNNEEE